MTHAYNELYLVDAKHCLAQFFDYAVNDCELSPDWVASLFVVTGYAEQFERGNPTVLAGQSGIELARAVITKAYGDKSLPDPQLRQGRTPEYWAGWFLAEYQWYYGRCFRDIFEHVPFSELLNMYPVYHEMDITQFTESLEQRIRRSAAGKETKLGRIRERRGLSQTELAEAAGIEPRSIQLFEQRVSDIDKAPAKTVYKLARVLGCNVEDLLENPMQ